MEKLFYQTQRRYAPGARRYEEGSTEPSQTVVGQAKTIKQLLARALQGIPTPDREVNYFDPEDVDNIDEYFAPGLDLTDLDDLRRRNDQAAKAIQKAEENKAKAEADAKKAGETAKDVVKTAASSDKPAGDPAGAPGASAPAGAKNN